MVQSARKAIAQEEGLAEPRSFSLLPSYSPSSVPGRHGRRPFLPIVAEENISIDIKREPKVPVPSAGETIAALDGHVIYLYGEVGGLCRTGIAHSVSGERSTNSLLGKHKRRISLWQRSEMNIPALPQSLEMCVH